MTSVGVDAPLPAPRAAQRPYRNYACVECRSGPFSDVCGAASLQVVCLAGVLCRHSVFATRLITRARACCQRFLRFLCILGASPC